MPAIKIDARRTARQHADADNTCGREWTCQCAACREVRGETCQAAGCTRLRVARGLCTSHYRQRQREPGRPLRPLRPTKQVRLGSLRVSEGCAAALEARGPTATAAAKVVLEAWAKERE